MVRSGLLDFCKATELASVFKGVAFDFLSAKSGSLRFLEGMMLNLSNNGQRIRDLDERVKERALFLLSGGWNRRGRRRKETCEKEKEMGDIPSNMKGS